MSENALLYELLVNKQKMKTLSNKQEKEQQSLTFTLDDTDILHNTNQIFSMYCKSSSTIKDNVHLFNEFLESELPLLVNKFEKHCIGKTE